MTQHLSYSYVLNELYSFLFCLKKTVSKQNKELKNILSILKSATLRNNSVNSRILELCKEKIRNLMYSNLFNSYI